MSSSDEDNESNWYDDTAVPSMKQLNAMKAMLLESDVDSGDDEEVDPMDLADEPVTTTLLADSNPEFGRDPNELLPPPPKDFEWVKGLPPKLVEVPWEEVETGNRRDYSSYSLLQIFGEMVSDPLDKIIEYTNDFGRYWYSGNWKDLDRPLIVKFIALFFHMDCARRSALRDYWRKGISADPVVEALGISYHDFVRYYTALRLYDTTTTKKRPSKTYKAEEFINSSIRKFQEMRLPKWRELSLDEMMTKFRGRCAFLQTIKTKPIPTGLKFYALCCPYTGYVYSFKLHTSQPELNEDVWGRILAIVYDVLSGNSVPGSHNFLDKGYFIAVDKYYTSTQMLIGLKGRNTYCVGTLKSVGRSLLPKEIMTKKVAKELSRGHVLYLYGNCGGISALSWQDNSLLTALTTLPNVGTGSTCVKRRGVDRNNNFFKITVGRPDAISVYSATMGGTDLTDQKIASRKQHHRSKRWYMSGVFLHILDIAHINSTIIFQDYNPDFPNHRAKSTLVALIIERTKVLQQLPSSIVTVLPPTTQKPQPLPAAQLQKDRLNRRLYHYHRFHPTMRKWCFVCKSSRVVTFCLHCGVFLCICTSDKICWEEFHEVKDLQQN